MKFFLATALFSLALAAPTTSNSDKDVREVTRRAEAHTCPGGLTNSSPMCCSVNILGLLALDCHNVPDGGCSGAAKANCCTLGLAGQGVICNEQ